MLMALTYWAGAGDKSKGFPKPREFGLSLNEIHWRNNLRPACPVFAGSYVYS